MLTHLWGCFRRWRASTSLCDSVCMCVTLCSYVGLCNVSGDVILCICVCLSLWHNSVNLCWGQGGCNSFYVNVNIWVKCLCPVCFWLLRVSVFLNVGGIMNFFGGGYLCVSVWFCDFAYMYRTVWHYNSVHWCLSDMIPCTSVCVSGGRLDVHTFMCRRLRLFCHVSVYHPHNPSPGFHETICSKDKNHFQALAFAAPLP